MFFKQFTIIVRDLEKSIAFYEMLTGLALTCHYKEGPAELAFLVNKDGEIEIELVSSPNMENLKERDFSSAL